MGSSADLGIHLLLFRPLRNHLLDNQGSERQVEGEEVFNLSKD
jgi:hypothetical protein